MVAIITPGDQLQIKFWQNFAVTRLQHPFVKSFNQFFIFPVDVIDLFILDGFSQTQTVTQKSIISP